jgi:KDO2-lipid IV(A) lauroyltransferase
MSFAHRVEFLFARSLFAIVRALPVGAALLLGARLGDLARLLGIRREVAAANLALAFPERTAAERERILVDHYRDLGMMLCEAARGRAVTHAPEGAVVVAARGLEHLEGPRRAGRGAILLTGHYGDYGLLAGWLGRRNPVDLLVQGIKNPAIDALIDETCSEGGVRRWVGGSGVRHLVRGLRENRWTFLLGDQDAGRGGVFVPFLGRLSSTSSFPAELSLRTGAPIVMAFITRRTDGRHEIDVLPPLVLERPEAPDAVERLTALHAAELERWVRRHPPMWFWLHRRWKTPPPGAGRNGDVPAPGGMALPAAPAAGRA